MRIGYHLNITNIRLAGTSGPYHGRIELEVNGTWGTVADDYFESTDGQVVCRMLGLGYELFILFISGNVGISYEVYVACGLKKQIKKNQLKTINEL